VDLHQIENSGQIIHSICDVFCSVFSLHNLDDEMKVGWVWR